MDPLDLPNLAEASAADAEPDTNPGAPASLAHVEIWQGRDGARGYTIATPEGGIGTGPIRDLVAALHLRDLLPALMPEPPPAPIFVEAPKQPAPGTPGAMQRGFWSGTVR